MRSSIYWIDHPKGCRLGIMSRPRSGEWLRDEIEAWQADGVEVVLSLLEPDEVGDLELGEEAGLCRALGIDFISFPIPDRGVPGTVAEAKAMAVSICRLGDEGKAVAIHCRAGIGRSALMAAAVLVLSGLKPSEAFEAVGRARGLSVPDTDSQRQWLSSFHEGGHEG